MFEDSTFASTGRIRMRSRAGFAAAFLFDTAIVLALVLVPLLYPSLLPHKFIDVLLNVPVAPVEQPKPAPLNVAPHPVQAILNLGIQAPTTIPKYIDYTPGPEPQTPANVADLISMEQQTGSNNPFDSGAHVTVARGTEPHTVRVSSSVVEGLLIQKTLPVYPPLARATHTQGTVVLQATISQNGAIENLRVATGPPMLLQAALDAVSTWRYRPYLLNGQPIAVETTVNVVFRLDQ
jgi:protein TonB